MIAPFEVQYVCREVERELAEAETGGTFVKQVSLRAVNRPSPPIADTRLSGMRLIIARSVWIVLMLLSCGLYLAAVLVYYVQLHGFQEGVYAHLISTPAVVSGYDAFEFSSALLTGPYATLNFTLVTLVLPPFWIAVSLVIFWRRSDDSMARWPPVLLGPLLLGLAFAWGFAQLYRYRRVSTTIQRQQTKWIVFGMLVAM